MFRLDTYNANSTHWPQKSCWKVEKVSAQNQKKKQKAVQIIGLNYCLRRTMQIRQKIRAER